MGNILQSLLLIFFAVITSLPAFAGEKITVGFPQDDMSNKWRKHQVLNLKDELDEYKNITFIYSDAGGSVSKHIFNTKKMIQRDIDILVISPSNKRLMAPVITEAYEKGIKVVLLTRKIEGESYHAFLAPDDYQIGVSAAKYISKKLDYKGDVLMIKGLEGTTSASKRTEGFLDTVSKYKGVSILKSENGNYLTLDALKIMDGWLQNDIDFDALYCQSDSMFKGAYIAMKKYNLNIKELITVSVDYISYAKIMLKKDILDATFKYPTMAKEAAEMILKIINGSSYERNTMVGSEMITKENADEINPIF